MRTSSRGSGLVGLVAAAALALGGGLGAGCAGPYTGTAEKLKKPPKKKMPEEAVAAGPEIKWAAECQAKFQEDNGKAMDKHKKGAAKGASLAGQGTDLLEQASRATEEQQIAGLTKEAIAKLRAALLEDPYQVDATFNLAVGYARSRRKGCAIAMLKRLAELEKSDAFGAAARRKVKEAEDDAAFSLFRKEANEALGR